MLTWLINRASQGQRTLAYPAEPANMPETYLGRPTVHATGKSCPPDCQECLASCPTDAIALQPAVSLDLGRCVFCSECVQSCPEQIFKLSNDFRTASTSREGLKIRNDEAPVVEKLQESMLRIFGRSMRIRHVSAGDCGGCKDEFNAMSNIVFDLSRFGIGVVASPRHADLLLVSGPIPENMRVALENAIWPYLNPGWWSPWVRVPSAAARTWAARSAITGSSRSCLWICTYQAARPTR